MTETITRRMGCQITELRQLPDALKALGWRGTNPPFSKRLPHVQAHGMATVERDLDGGLRFTAHAVGSDGQIRTSCCTLTKWDADLDRYFNDRFWYLFGNCIKAVAL